MRRVLHVGCGGEYLPPWLTDAETTEVRLDIVDDNKPDIVASILDMGEIGEFDVVFHSHTLEHVYPHEVPVALSECMRVLKDGGAMICFVPNLENVKATDEVLYISPSGPIAGLDMIYGGRHCLKDYPYMAHHTGFVPDTLRKAMTEAGFKRVVTKDVGTYNLMGVGFK